eukprot:GHVN01106281.1.p1 GENE.GHVN01106281.1~~GHVN01106281.1.p1  ORF type:complete len:625 (-),score=187.79 GHVN01106281.1:128-1942(-)
MHNQLRNFSPFPSQPQLQPHSTQTRPHSAQPQPHSAQPQPHSAQTQPHSHQYTIYRNTAPLIPYPPSSSHLTHSHHPTSHLIHTPHPTSHLTHSPHPTSHLANSPHLTISPWWFTQFAQVIRDRHGLHLAHLLRVEVWCRQMMCDDYSIDKALKQIGRFENGPFSFGDHPNKPNGTSVTLRPVVEAFLKAMREMSQGHSSEVRWENVVTHASAMLTGYINVIKTDRAGPCYKWLAPGLMIISRFLAKAGREADKQSDSDHNLAAELTGEDEVEEEREESGENKNQVMVLNKFRNFLGFFRGDDRRQATYILLVTESIKSCLALRNMNLAQSFLTQLQQQSNWMKQSEFVASVPKGSMVSFQFNLGKLEMQRDLVEPSEKAESALLWAFANSRATPKMKRSILNCLLVVRLQLGKIPSNILMQKYNLNRYREVVEALTKGNVKLFEHAMDNYWSEFTDDGTFFLLERMKFFVYRTALKNTYIWATKHLMAGSSTPHIMPIGVFTAALKWQIDGKNKINNNINDIDNSMTNNDNLNNDNDNALRDIAMMYEKYEDKIEFDDEEMLCIFSNLIKMRWVLGYVAWEHRKIVFAKGKDPFPPLRKSISK